MSSRPGATPYTVDKAAPRGAVDAACRGVLVALRDALEILCIDLEADYPWPDEATEALVTLEPKRRKFRLFRNRQPNISADLRLIDDEEFEAALVIAPHTICATGITHDSFMAYNADDSGESQWFELTADELVIARDYMATQGQDPAFLVSADDN